MQMDLSKNNRFWAEEAKNYIPRTEKREKVLVCEIFELLNSMWNTWILCEYFVLLHALNFIMETEDNSLQTQLYDTSTI